MEMWQRAADSLLLVDTYLTHRNLLVIVLQQALHGRITSQIANIEITHLHFFLLTVFLQQVPIVKHPVTQLQLYLS